MSGPLVDVDEVDTGIVISDQDMAGFDGGLWQVGQVLEHLAGAVLGHLDASHVDKFAPCGP